MRFKEARLKSGKSVQEVREALGCSDAAIYLWETGKTEPRIDKLIKLSQLYGVSIDYLLGSDPPVATE